MSDYEARLLDDASSWGRNTVRIAVRRRVGNRIEFMMADGLWVSVDDGVLAPPDMGIEIPRAAIEAIAVGIQEWQGHTSHADTEARVLREWLAVERERVDRALSR